MAPFLREGKSILFIAAITGFYERLSPFLSGHSVRKVFDAGCLVLLIAAVVGVIVAVAVYPNDRWLFAVPAGAILLGILLMFVAVRSAKDPTPKELADDIERLLTGTSSRWGVDNFESMHLRDPYLEACQQRCLSVGLPEAWPAARDDQKAILREVIEELRQH